MWVAASKCVSSPPIIIKNSASLYPYILFKNNYVSFICGGVTTEGKKKDPWPQQKSYQGSWAHRTQMYVELGRKREREGGRLFFVDHLISYNKKCDVRLDIVYLLFGDYIANFMLEFLLLYTRRGELNCPTIMV